MLRNWLRALISYLQAPTVVRAADEKSELREEIEFHLTSSVQEHIDGGMASQQSQQAALERFGDVRAVLDDCSEESVAQHVVWHRIHQAVTVALVSAVALLGYLALRTPTARSVKSELSTSPALLHASGYSLVETHGDITGSVVGDRGEPLEAAHLLAVVKTWPPNGYRQQSYMATTRADGTFALEDVYPPEHDYEVQIAAIADGRLLKSEYTTLTKGTLKPFRFQLGETTPFALRFEADDGAPVVGVSAFPFERIDSDGQRHCVYFCSADPIVRESSAIGHVSMPHFLPGEQATIFVRFPNSDWQKRQLVVPNDEQVVVLTGEDL